MTLPNPVLTLGIYRHYKGALYHVRGLARHSETGEWMVFYRCQYGDFSDWVRPFSMFTERLEQGGVLVPRFTYCGAAAEPAQDDQKHCGHE